MLGCMKRRQVLGSLASLCAAVHSRAGEVAAPSRGPVQAPVKFPADFGAHPERRIEWWYVTGALQAGSRLFGFQVTFFRSRTPLAAGHPSRFAAGQLIFAHTALSEVATARQRHDQRVARSGFGIAQAAEGDTQVRLRGWTLTRERHGAGLSRYLAQVDSAQAGFGLQLTLLAAQQPLLQGLQGWSQKGPTPDQSSHYYSEPQLQVSGLLTLDGQALSVQGLAWLDHEWSDLLLDPQGQGWDWAGLNLDDGSALTAFRQRGADGRALYAGGSWRSPDGRVRNFAPNEVRFTPLRHWTSPASQARYPVEWRLATPAGEHRLRALFDAQELDSRASTGAFYWEGLSELLDAQDRRLGRGYLEMTGYAARLLL